MNIMRYLWGFLIFLFLFISVGGSFVNAKPKDWLRKVYEKSHQPGDGEPYSVNAEAEDMFDTQIDVIGTIGNIKDSKDGIDGNDIAFADSIFVRTTRYLAKIAVILAVPMLFYIAIKIVLAFGDEGKMKEALKQAGYIVGGLLLVLLSVMIVYLILSLARSNVNLF